MESKTVLGIKSIYHLIVGAKDPPRGVFSGRTLAGTVAVHL